MHLASASVEALNALDPRSLLSALGALGVFLILFAETGLLIGFFLPGDSLLFTAGLLCTTGASATVPLSLPAVLVAAATGALTGAQAGYALGRRVGPRLLDRADRPRLQDGVRRGRAALDRYGPAKAIVLARFIPLVRTVLNPLAGTVGVPVRTFTVWQVAGGLLWAFGVTLAGYALGARIPDVDRYLLPIVAVLVVVSLIPVALELVRSGAPIQGADIAITVPTSTGRARCWRSSPPQQQLPPSPDCSCWVCSPPWSGACAGACAPAG